MKHVYGKFSFPSQFVLSIAILLVTVLVPGISFGQGAVGSIAGTVRDASGALIPNATVTVIDVATNLSQNVKTNSSGEYSVRFLKPSIYNVIVEAAGFSKEQVNSIRLQVDQIARADVTLKAGQVTSTVSVNASTIALDTDSATIGQVITERQVLDLPLNNRDFTNLLLLSPGAVTTGINVVGPTGSTLSVSGARTTSNGFLIDGLTNTDLIWDLRAVFLSLDAVQEFKQQATTYSAEYGGAATQINLSTKSGSNSLHGTAFEFNRNDAYDARSFFDQAGVKLPPLRQNNYGYSLGGPVYLPWIYNGRNRSFFFANFERLKATSSKTLHPLVPTANDLQGVIASAVPVLDPETGAPFAQDTNGNYLIPQSRWSRLATVATATPGRYFPTPIAYDPNTGGNSVVVISSPADQRQQTYRFDQQLTSADRMFARFTLTNFMNTTNGNTNYGNSVAAITTQSWVVNETHTFNANLVNQAFLGWLAYANTATGTTAPDDDLTALKLTNTYPINGDAFPALQFGAAFSTAGGAVNMPGYGKEKIWNFADTLSWLHGSHSISAGFLGLIDQSIFSASTNPLGVYSFDGTGTAPQGAVPTAGNTFADFLLGDITTGSAGIPTPYSANAPFAEYVDQNKFAIFVSDNWKIRNNLTVIAGVRYDYQGVPFEEKNHWFWRDVTAPGGALCTADKSLITSGVGGTLYEDCGKSTPNSSPKTPFAPRLSFAWTPLRSNNTVIRGGYGIFFDQYQLTEFSSGGLYPYTETYNSSHQFSDTLFPTIPPAAPVTSADLGFVAVLQAPVIRNPYIQSWSLSVQEALGSNTKLDVAYVGSKGTHLETRIVPSQPTSYNPSDPAAGYPLYNFGTFGQNGTPFAPGWVIEGNFGAKSNYNAMQVSLDHRTKNSAVLAAFTWGSAMDTASSQAGAGLEYTAWAGPMDGHDLNRDYSKSSYDVNRRFVLSYVYQLPFGRGERFGANANRALDLLIGGWQINGIYQAQTGTPFSVLAVDLGGALQTVGQRADQIGSPYPKGFHKSYKEWYDISAYTQPAIGVFGTVPRNSIRAAGLNNWDASAFKNFHLIEQMQFQLRGEAFNVLNHTQFGAPPYGLVGNPSQATINTTLMPGRIIQLGGKLIF
jgi:hypothetical protein